MCRWAVLIACTALTAPQLEVIAADAAPALSPEEASVNIKGYKKRFPNAPGIDRVPGLFCLDLHDRLHEQKILLPGSLYRELCRQAVLIAARDELGMATRDRALREAFPLSDTPADWPLSVMVQVTRDHIATVTVYQARQDSVQLLWEQAISLDRNAPYESLSKVTERLSREDFRDLLLSHGYEQVRSPVTADDDGVAPEIEKQLTQWNDISQFAAIRALHAAIAQKGESPERLAALSRGYANLSNLTDAYCGPMLKTFSARSLLYAQRLASKYAEAPQAKWTQAYVFCLAGLPETALRCLDQGESDATNGSAPQWLDSVTAYCRGDLARVRQLAAADPADALPVFLLWREARLRKDLLARLQAIAEVLQRDPDCIRAMFDVPLAGSLGAKAGAHLTLQRVVDLAGRRLGDVAGLPDAVRDRLDELSLDDGATFAAVVKEIKQAGAPTADLAEPSLGVLGQLLNDAAFTSTWQVMNYEQNALGIDVRHRGPELLAWVDGHPYAKALTARVATGAAWTAAGRELLNTMQKADIDGWCADLMAYFYQADRLRGYRLYAGEATHFDQTVPDLATRLARTQSDLERRRSVAELQRIAPNLPSTVEAQLQYTAKGLTGELPQLEERFSNDASVLQLLSSVNLALGDSDAAERCTRQWIAVSPSYDAWSSLAEIKKLRNDMPAWIEASEAALEQPVLGLEHAETRSALAEYFLGLDDPQRALPYAEQAAQTGAAWAMLRAAEVHERLGNLDAAAQYRAYVSQRYSSQALNWCMWCLRTGGGDLEESLEFAERTLWDWGSELSYENQTRAAMIEMVRDDWTAAYQRMLPIGRRTTEPFYVWFAAMLAESQQANAERSELLQRVVALESAGNEIMLKRTGRIAASVDRELSKSPDQKLDVSDLDREIAQLESTGMTNLWYFVSEMLRARGQDVEAREYLRRAAASPQPDLWSQFLAAHFLRVAGEEVELRKYEFVPPREPIEDGRSVVFQTDQPVMSVRLHSADRVLFAHQNFAIHEWRSGESEARPWGKARGFLVDLTTDGSRALVVPKLMKSCEVWTRDGEEPNQSFSTTNALVRAARFMKADPDRIVSIEMRNSSETVPGSSLGMRNLATGEDEWRIDLGNRLLGGIFTGGADDSIFVTGLEGSTGWIGQYRASDGGEIRQYSIPRHPIDRFVISETGDVAATLSRWGEICLWDLTRLEPVHRLWDRGTSYIAISSDGSRLAAANDRTVRVYDLRDGRIAAEINDHLQPVSQVAFDPEETSLATAAADMTIRIYPLGNLEGPASTSLPAFEVVNSLGMSFEPIPAGTFLMGEADRYAPQGGYKESGVEHERPRHQVTLTRPFYLSQFETTRGQFQAFIDATGYVTDRERLGGGRHAVPPDSDIVRRTEFTWRNPGFEQENDEQPALQISWNDAQKFCAWLSETEGRQYRLPTEAEWEYACRAGSLMSFSGSNTADQNTMAFNNSADVTIEDRYNFFYIAAYWEDGYAFAAPVGQFSPNAWGLYDMHANASEWCSDFWQPDYYLNSPAVDAAGPRKGEMHVVRGGSFLSHPDDARSAHRSFEKADDAVSTSGFRIVLDAAEEP